MEKERIYSALKENMPGLILFENEPLSRHCSFKIGGQAAVFAVPGSPEETAELMRILTDAGIEPLIIGRGTNLLVADRPIDRVVIKIGDRMSELKPMGDTSVFAGAGANLANVATFAQFEGLAGLEFAHGIPGSLGGAVFMNAGAYGGEMKDVVASVTVLNGEGEIVVRSRGDLDFSYRHSTFSTSGEIILGAEMLLTRDDQDAIRDRMRDLAKKRKTSQPLEYPSAGSTFKRPPGGYAAAMIDEAGLKGYTVGGAQVSQKHAGFVINTGDATFSDVMGVINHVRNEVFKKFGVTLELEVKIIE